MSVVAVYGTLRHGGSANSLMKEAKYLGKDTISGKLYNLGAYPGVRLSEAPEEKVQVDLYEVPDSLIPQLDRYEGCIPGDTSQSLYNRVVVTTNITGHEASVYEYNAQPNGTRLIPSGDWFDARNV